MNSTRRMVLVAAAAVVCALVACGVVLVAGPAGAVYAVARAFQRPQWAEHEFAFAATDAGPAIVVTQRWRPRTSPQTLARRTVLDARGGAVREQAVRSGATEGTTDPRGPGDEVVGERRAAGPPSVTFSSGATWRVEEDELRETHAAQPERSLGRYPQGEVVGGLIEYRFGGAAVGLVFAEPEGALLAFREGDLRRTFARVSRDGTRVWTRSLESLANGARFEDDTNHRPWFHGTSEALFVGLTRDTEAFVLRVDVRTGQTAWVRAVP